MSKQEVQATKSTIRIARLYAGEDGESHYEDVDMETTEVDFAPPAPPVLVTAPKAAQRYLFLSTPAGWFGDLHPAPARQLMMVVSGGLEATASDGETRRFAPGDAILVEDTTGKGHTTRNPGGEAVIAVVQL